MFLSVFMPFSQSWEIGTYLKCPSRLRSVIKLQHGPPRFPPTSRRTRISRPGSEQKPRHRRPTAAAAGAEGIKGPRRPRSRSRPPAWAAALWSSPHLSGVQPPAEMGLPSRGDTGACPVPTTINSKWSRGQASVGREGWVAASSGPLGCCLCHRRLRLHGTRTLQSPLTSTVW